METKYHATLSFDRERLLYDIANNCYIEGDLMEEGAEHSRHLTQDVADQGNIDRVNRQLQLLHAIVVEMLYPYTSSEVVTADTAKHWSDALVEDGQFTIDLSLPENFSQTTLNLLEQLVYDWLVSMTMADWLSFTNPIKSDVWRAKALDTEERIRTAIVSRRGHMRRRLSPF